MNFEIEHDGRTYQVSTVTGEGLTKVVFTEIEPEPEQPTKELKS